MVRLRQYRDEDVLTAARARMRRLYDEFDHVVVNFSGGKDSLVCVHLAKEVADEYGLRVNVAFRDEELIPDSVIGHVDKYRQLPWVDLRWYCLPMSNTQYVLGRTAEYVQWDPTREWVRPMPEWGIRPTDVGLPDDAVVMQLTMDEITIAPFPGRVASVTGVRASESLSRYRVAVGKLGPDCWINMGTGGKLPRRMALCRPIYDWSQTDVFVYMAQHEIEWTSLYEHQYYAGAGLRVSTPLHYSAARKFDLVAATDGDFYDRVVRVFPEMVVQGRYFREVDHEPRIQAYLARGWAGAVAAARENFEGRAREVALLRVDEYRRWHRKHPEEYPIENLIRRLLTGTLRGRIKSVDLRESAASMATRARQEGRTG